MTIPSSAAETLACASHLVPDKSCASDNPASGKERGKERQDISNRLQVAAANAIEEWFWA